MVRLPPIPVTSTSGANIKAGQQNHTFSRPVFNFCMAIMSLSRLKFKLGVKDDASGNNKFIAEERLDPRFVGWIIDYISCLNHQNMLTHLDCVIAIFGMVFLRRVHAVASFFNMGNHRLRMMLVVSTVIEQLVDFEVGTPCAGDILYSTTLCAFLCFHADLASMIRKTKGGKVTGCTRATLIRLLFSLVQGGFTKGRLIVMTSTPRSDAWKKEHLKRIQECVLDLIITPLFPIPSTGFWLKTGPSWDRILLSMMCGMLNKLFDEALSRISFEERCTDGERELESMMSEWNAVGGKNKARTKATLRDPETWPTLHEASVLDHGCRVLARAHLYWSYKPFDTFTKEDPTILEVYVNPGRSPVYAALLYYAMLLRGRLAYWVLVWYSRGASSFEEWFNNNLQAVWRMFRGGVMYSASIRRRQWSQMENLGIFGIEDPALQGTEVVRGTVTSFVGSTREQLGDGLAGQYWTYQQNRASSAEVVVDAMVALRVDGVSLLSHNSNSEIAFFFGAAKCSKNNFI